MNYPTPKNIRITLAESSGLSIKLKKRKKEKEEEEEKKKKQEIRSEEVLMGKHGGS